MTNKTLIASAVALAVGGGVSTSASAALASNAVLMFDAGYKTCVLGTDPNTATGCAYDVQTTVGSYFSMDANGDGSVADSEKTPIAPNEGIKIGVLQPTSGQSHSGDPTGTEVTSIDMAWGFFGNTGMHNTPTTPITILSDDGAGNVTLDFSGWSVDWNGIEDIPMGGDTANFASDTGVATLTCAVDCAVGDTFTLSYAAHVPLGDASGFGGVPYTVYLEGTVQAVPVPAAVWLFGSGLVGLVGVARRKRQV